MISKEIIFRTSDNKTFISESSATKHEKSLEDGTCIYVLYQIDRDAYSIIDIVGADESYSKIYKYGLELEEAMKKNESFYYKFILFLHLPAFIFFMFISYLYYFRLFAFIS